MTAEKLEAAKDRSSMPQAIAHRSNEAVNKARFRRLALGVSVLALVGLMTIAIFQCYRWVNNRHVVSADAVESPNRDDSLDWDGSGVAVEGLLGIKLKGTNGQVIV